MHKSRRLWSTTHKSYKNSCLEHTNSPSRPMCCSWEQSKQICGETMIKQTCEDISDLQQFAAETDMVSLHVVATMTFIFHEILQIPPISCKMLAFTASRDTKLHCFTTCSFIYYTILFLLNLLLASFLFIALEKTVNNWSLLPSLHFAGFFTSLSNIYITRSSFLVWEVPANLVILYMEVISCFWSSSVPSLNLLLSHPENDA